MEGAIPVIFPPQKACNEAAFILRQSSLERPESTPEVYSPAFMAKGPNIYSDSLM